MAGWGWDWFDKLVDFLNWFGTGIWIKVWQRVEQISRVPYPLPSEIITDILCRLPVKSLLRFRCVSKPWCSLIDSPYFIKLHLNHSLKTNTNLTLILTDHKANIFSVNFDTLSTAIKLNNPLIQKTDGDIIRVLGSCNGLIALVNYRISHRDEHDIVLWNPSTRNYHILPALPIEILIDFYESKFYGFGYDPVSDDYKLVRIVVYPCLDDQDLTKSQAKVYSFKSNSWRPTRDFPCCCYPLQRHGILVNNTLHWMVVKKGERPSDKRFVAFDLRVEEYFEVVLPDYMDHFMCLKSLGGCLCVLCDYDELGVVIWVMKEYGVKESWIKLFSLVLSDDFVTLNPLAYSKSGDRVLLYEDDRYDEKYFWYDPKRKRAEKIRIQGAPKLFDVEMCVASLVPLMVGVEPMP